MQTFSVRFTPHPKGLDDISGYSFGYLDKFEKYILAREEKDKTGQSVPVHYHIYIETSYGDATVRQTTKEALRLPAGGRGKNNGYYSLIPNWKDPGYICKYNDVQSSKGFTEKELMDFVISGKKTYLDKVKTPAEHSVTAVVKAKPIPFQQEVINNATVLWYKYKTQCREQGFEIDKYQLVEFVSQAMVDRSRGINPYLLQELCNTILFNDGDFREYTIQRLKSKIHL